MRRPTKFDLIDSVCGVYEGLRSVYEEKRPAFCGSIIHRRVLKRESDNTYWEVIYLVETDDGSNCSFRTLVSQDYMIRQVLCWKGNTDPNIVLQLEERNGITAIEFTDYQKKLIGIALNNLLGCIVDSDEIHDWSLDDLGKVYDTITQVGQKPFYPKTWILAEKCETDSA